MHIHGVVKFYILLFNLFFCQCKDVRNHSKWKYLPLKKCGHGSLSDRIVGGKEASLGEYPWMAQLGYEEIKNKISFLCAGSLINRWYVLTAKHCFYDELLKIAKTVRLGENFLKTKIDCDRDVCAPPVQDIYISKIISYEISNSIPLNYADIALVKLSKPARFNDFVSPICLPRGNVITNIQTYLSMGTTVKIAGWGLLDSGTEALPERLMHIDLPVVPLSTCKKTFPVNKIDHSQLCIGTGHYKDTCLGDSGGPVMKAIADNSPPKYYIVGLVSYGMMYCGLSAAVYTNVTHYLDWILDHIDPIL